MSAAMQELLAILDLEEIEHNLYRGRSPKTTWQRVFGGQTIAQALVAAQRTVPVDRHVHSLHGYFMRIGDTSVPIVYQVDRIRDGGSFTTRRVVAKQRGRAIFHLSASFQTLEPGFEHQDPMPEVPTADALGPEADVFAKRSPGPFDFRPVEKMESPLAPAVRPPHRDVWIRGRGTLGDDPALHATLLAYVSDFYFVGTSLLPHGVSWLTPGMQVASLDHAMWFHADFRADDWLLHSMESPRASRGRGLVRGRVFSRDGRLVASSTQEGLIRKKPA